MSGAIRMQQRGASRARRVLAAIGAVWLVAFGVLAVRHESRVAHYVDAETGDVFHASGMVGAHTTSQSDVHASDDGAPDHGACGISSAFHQASSPVAHVELAIASVTATASGLHVAGAVVCANQLVYLIAPKTSPPIVA